MTVLTAASRDHREIPASSIDRAIRLSAAAAVLAVAAIAAYVSYWHAYAVVRAHGETGITARLEPATIDGLVYASSMVVLQAAWHRVPCPALARWLPGPGIAATLTANMAQGWSHGPAGAVVAAWPAVSLVGSYELLVWLIRAAAPEHGPLAAQPGGGTASSAPGGSLPPAGTANGGQLSRDDGAAPDQARQPGSQPAAHTTGRLSVRRDDQARDRDAVNDQAVAAYRLSMQAGNPLSERKLARMFGRTSRRWARARITEARQAPAGTGGGSAGHRQHLNRARPGYGTRGS